MLFSDWLSLCTVPKMSNIKKTWVAFNNENRSATRDSMATPLGMATNGTEYN